MAELTLEQIFNRTENLEYTKEYKYIEQQGITGKPSIVAGGENLKSFPLNIKLHYSFCNPQNIIDEIEEKAENREVINYFQNGKYIGDYVINRLHVNSEQKIDDVLIYAEIEVELLENPDSITEFEQQTKTQPNITQQAVSANSNKMQKFLSNAKNLVVNGVYDSVVSALQSGDLSALGETGVKIFNTLQNSIISDIKAAGLNQAKPIVQKYLQNLNVSSVLTQAQTDTLKTELEKIPEKLIKSALRS